jgi:hypothetical protein
MNNIDANYRLPPNKTNAYLEKRDDKINCDICDGHFLEKHRERHMASAKHENALNKL